MSVTCKLFGHKPNLYGSQGRIYPAYHDGIGRAHRTVEAQCVRCDCYFRVGSVIDTTHQQPRAPAPAPKTNEEERI